MNIGTLKNMLEGMLITATANIGDSKDIPFVYEYNKGYRDGIVAVINSIKEYEMDEY